MSGPRTNRRPEPEPDPEADEGGGPCRDGERRSWRGAVRRRRRTAPVREPEEDEGLSPIADRLITELTAHRTLGLRQALGERPDVAFVAALHALALKAFYHYGSDSCLELDLKSVSFSAQAPGLNDSASAEAIRVIVTKAGQRHCRRNRPTSGTRFTEMDGDRRAALFAHGVSLSVNAVHEAWNQRPRALAHADRLAEALDLDMAAAGWKPTVDNFLGRVTKARILQAVPEAKGQRAAERIEHLKKGDMAVEAEALLAGTGWLPEPLRTPGRTCGREVVAAPTLGVRLSMKPRNQGAKRLWRTRKAPLRTTMMPQLTRVLRPNKFSKPAPPGPPATAGLFLFEEHHGRFLA